MPPLVSQDPIEAVRPVYEKMLKVRESKTVALKPIALMRTTIKGLSGKPEPFSLRYYQVQGVYHLLMMPRMVLGDGTGLGKCVTEDTLLVTDRGLLPIWDLAPLGELTNDTFYEPRIPVKVRTGNGQTLAVVRRFYWCGQRETRRVTTRNGFRVEGSLVHPVLVRGPQPTALGFESMRKLPELQIGQDYICIDRGGSCFPAVEPSIPDWSAGTCFPSEMTPDLARLLGYMAAEARISMFWSQNANPEACADAQGLAESVLGWDGVSVISADTRKFLAACGNAAHVKGIPWSVLRATRLSVRNFLRGLFEGGSSVDSGSIGLSTMSERLLRALQTLLLRFGIISAISPIGRDLTYRLTISGEDARTFSHEIGFISEQKKSALLAAGADAGGDVVPYMRLSVAALMEAVANSAQPGSFQDVLKLHEHCDPTYQFLRQLLEAASAHNLTAHPAFLEVQSVVQQHYFYDPVTRVEEGFAPLMDVEVCHPSHQFSGNGFINHNTVETIAALCYLWATKEPDNKVIIVAPKSAIPQWADEIRRFTTDVEPVIAVGDAATRKRAYAHFATPGGHKALLLNYQILCRDWGHGQARPLLPNGRPDPKRPVVPGLLDGLTANIAADTVVVFDECTAFKNMRTKTWETCRFLADRSKRVYGLTATLLKNNLMEGFSIFKCIRPEIFATKTAFLDTYCIVKMQPTSRGMKIPIVIGYRNLEHFRSRIDPFFLGRPKYAVSDELPTLTTKEVRFTLAPLEEAKYREALSGLLELGDGELKDYEEHKAFVSLTYCQQIVNSLAMLRFQEGDDSIASKEQALVDLVSEALDGEKVIVYSRFESHIARLVALLAKQGVKSVRITGKEGEGDRRKAQKAFQDLESSVKVVFITDAGSEAINLQAASAMIFYDAPWSWGNYVQCIGRMIRIGSPHKGVLVYHLVSERPGDDPDTIDGHVLNMLRRKKSLIDRVIGEAAVGALEFDERVTKTLLRKMQKFDA